jgi:hypothetical protein
MMMPIMEPVFRPESALEDEDGFGDDAEVGVEAEEGAAPALYVLSVVAPVGKSATGNIHLLVIHMIQTL